jgi:hypothetical protein
VGLLAADLDPLTLSIGGQGEIGDMAGRVELVTAILNNNEAAARDALASSAQDTRRQMLQAQLHSGQSVVHVAVMFNRVWALKLLREQGVDLSAPLHCNIDVSQLVPCANPAMHILHL